MSENKLSQLEKKKQALEIELTRIQSDLDKSIDDVRDDVSDTFAPKSIIRKYPLPAVGAALVLGFLVGKEKKKSTSGNRNKKESSNGVGSVVSHELKNVLTRKGVHFLLDYIENSIPRLKEKNLDKTS